MVTQDTCEDEMIQGSVAAATAKTTATLIGLAIACFQHLKNDYLL